MPTDPENRQRLRALYAYLALVLVAACTGEPPSGPEAPTSSGSPSATASADPAGSSVGVVDAFWSFEVVHTKPVDDRSMFYDGDYLVIQGHWDGGRDLTVERVGDGEVVLRHDASEGHRTEEVFLEFPWLVVTELEFEFEDYDIPMFRYDLRTGEQTRLHGRSDLPTPTEPEMASYGRHLFYATGDSKTEKCMVDLDLDTLAAEKVYCGPTGWVVGDPKPSRDGLVLSEVRPGDEGGQERCKRLVVLPHGSEQPRPMAPEVAECDQWSGNLIGDTVAWNEIDRADPEFMSGAPAYASTGGGDPVELGKTDTESIITCGDWFYWRWGESINRQRFNEIRRWKPGSPIEVIYRPEDLADTIPGRLHCAGEELVFPQHIGVGEESREELLAAALRP